MVHTYLQVFSIAGKVCCCPFERQRHDDLCEILFTLSRLFLENSNPPVTSKLIK